MKHFILLLSIFLTQICYGQLRINGKIVDEKKEPASFVTVLLVQANDSTKYVATQSSLEGFYTFPNVKPGSYRIVTSFIGYSKSYSDFFTLITNNIEIPTIQIFKDSKLLKDVTVYSKKNFLEQRADKLIVNVQASPVSAGATALEVLRRVPGIQIQNDKISINGKNKVSIMIDGKLSQYADMNAVVREIPSSNIDKIEVITNPSAKNEAEGGAVINIIMKRNTALGTNGSLSLTQAGGIYDQKIVNKGNLTYHRISPVFNINHRSRNWNIYGNYGYLNRSVFEINLINRQFNNELYDQKNYNPTSYNYHTFRTGVDYYMDSINTFGLLINGFQRAGIGRFEGISTKTDMQTDNLLDIFKNRNDQKTKTGNFNLNLNWKHQFTREGRTLNIDADIASYAISNQNDAFVEPQTGNTLHNFQINRTPINLQTLKVDYSHPLTKNSRLEMGIKSSLAKIDNDLEFKENDIYDDKRSNKFRYTENINAVYLALLSTIDKWDFQVGLRAEHTRSEGKIGQELLVDRNYIQPFPSVLVTRHLDSVFAITAQYGRRIDRPKFQQQNPFEFYIDPQTYTKGNPTIKPQLSHSGKLSITYTGLPFLVFTYDRTNDVIFDYAPQQKTIIDSNNEPRLVSYSVADNLAEYKNLSIQLNFPIRFKNLIEGHGGGIACHQKYNALYLGTNYNKSKWNYTFYSELNLKFSPTFSGQVSGYYAGTTLFEFIETKYNSSIDIGLEKKILNRLGSITLNLSDIFYQNKTIGTIEFQDIRLRLNQYHNTRNIRLTFNYSFGNQQLKGSRKRNTASEEENKRVDTK